MMCTIIGTAINAEYGVPGDISKALRKALAESVHMYLTIITYKMPRSTNRIFYRENVPQKRLLLFEHGKFRRNDLWCITRTCEIFSCTPIRLVPTLLHIAF